VNVLAPSPRPPSRAIGATSSEHHAGSFLRDGEIRLDGSGDNNYPVVANIVAPSNNHPPGYPNETIYHYFAVTGYNPSTRQVYIADSANFGGNQQYWLTFDQLATMIPPKGYASYSP
jgi:hypothetical protein